MKFKHYVYNLFNKNRRFLFHRVNSLNLLFNKISSTRKNLNSARSKHRAMNATLKTTHFQSSRIYISNRKLTNKITIKSQSSNNKIFHHRKQVKNPYKHRRHVCQNHLHQNPFKFERLHLPLNIEIISLRLSTNRRELLFRMIMMKISLRKVQHSSS